MKSKFYEDHHGYDFDSIISSHTIHVLYVLGEVG